MIGIQSHICILTERPDITNRGVLRWALPDEERCLCKGVVALHVSPTNLCTREITEDTLWFVDDPRPLTRRQNWNKTVLDQLLDRQGSCGKTLKIYLKKKGNDIFCESKAAKT